MDIIELKLEELTPYEKNPRFNGEAVEKVAASLQEFGWKQPIVVDRDGVIIAGHTRYFAAKRLGFETVPVLIAEDLTDEQVRAYRLADNKTAEFSGWDFDLLNAELFEINDICMGDFGFDMTAVVDGMDFFDRERVQEDETARQEGNDEYNEFLDKFELKKTTDDCYTPVIVYDAVADWVAAEYGLDRDKFVRPFYPGGDYQRFKYEPDDVVVDNPPFSIMAEILQFYLDHGVKFFIFCQGVTAFSSAATRGSTVLATGVTITYENGANVSTSFLTNLEDPRIRAKTAPTLYKAVREAADTFAKTLTKEIPKYHYPDEVITASIMNRWSKYGVDQEFLVSDTEPVSALDAQKEYGKAIFGKGFLLSERAAAERAAAERTAAERAAAERAAATVWVLSDREKDIVKRLGEHHGD